jgi:hypothetical protein
VAKSLSVILLVVGAAAAGSTFVMKGSKVLGLPRKALLYGGLGALAVGGYLKFVKKQ